MIWEMRARLTFPSSLPQKSGITHLVSRHLFCSFPGSAVDDSSRFSRLLGSHPPAPGLPFQLVELDEFENDCIVKVTNARLTPLAANRFQIGRYGRLGNIQFTGNPRLRPTLNV